MSKDKSKGGKKGEIISPAQQMAAIQKVAREMGWTLLEPEQDIDYSGFRIHYSKRPGLMRLLEAAQRHEFEAVIVYAMNRLGRTAAEQLEIIRTFENQGCQVISATERFDTATAAGRLARNIQAPISQFQSEQLSQTIKDTRLAMVANGRPPGGLPPYGYRWQDKRLVPDPITAPIVREMFRIALAAGTNGTVRKVMAYLESIGARAPLSGHHWNPDSVRYVLKNPIYIGEQRYDGERYKVGVEPLVSEELWNGVQSLMQKGKGHNTARKNLMAGFLYCGYAGHKEEGWSPAVQFLYEYYSNHEGIRRYKCRTARRYLSVPSKCDHPMLAADGFEKEFVAQLIEWLRAQGAKDPEVETARAQEIAQTREAMERVAREIKTVSDAISSLFDDYHKFKVITREQFAERNRIYLQEQEDLKTEYAALEHRLSLLIRDPEEDRRAVVALEDAWDNLTLDERRNLIATVVKRLVVYKDRVTVETYGEPFDLMPTMFYRNVMYFHGEEPKQNPGDFKRGYDPRRANNPKAEK